MAFLTIVEIIFSLSIQLVRGTRWAQERLLVSEIVKNHKTTRYLFVKETIKENSSVRKTHNGGTDWFHTALYFIASDNPLLQRPLAILCSS